MRKIILRWAIRPPTIAQQNNDISPLNEGAKFCNNCGKPVVLNKKDIATKG